MVYNLHWLMRYEDGVMKYLSMFVRAMQNESMFETIEYLRVGVIKLCIRGGGEQRGYI